MRFSSEYGGGDKHKLICELFGDNIRLDAGFVQNMYYLSCTYMYFEPIDTKFWIQQTLQAVTVVLLFTHQMDVRIYHLIGSNCQCFGRVGIFIAPLNCVTFKYGVFKTFDIM